MMGYSFRARVILASVTVSGVVLAVFALSAWLYVYRAGLFQIDSDLAERVGPVVSISHPRSDWPLIARGLNMSYGGGAGGDGCLVLAKGAGGEILHQSPGWPADLPAAGFPVPTPTNPALRSFPTPPRPRAGSQSARDRRPHASTVPQWRFLPFAVPHFVTKRTGAGALRLCTMENSELALVLAVHLRPFEAAMARLRTGFLVALPLALLFVGGGSWLASSRALRSVEDLARVAEQVTTSNLDQRIAPESVATEFRRLTTVLNGMLDRLQRGLSQAVRFSADAAHELQTPLAVLQGAVEQALHHCPPGSEEQQTLGDVLEEVHRLKAITRKLLLLSRADSGQLRPTLIPVNLTQLVADVAEEARALAPLLEVSEDLRPGVEVPGDPDLLQQAVTNLSSNAMKYNREGGAVEFRLAGGDGTAELTVTNTGAGIPPEDLPRLFERFYRADASRSRQVDGVGLGLSLAREIARAHGGDLTLVEARDDRTSFRMTLPVAAAAAGGQAA
jgi:two-component system, OmpR family, heavy metal sensor histidine kinase CusS